MDNSYDLEDFIDKWDSACDKGLFKREELSRKKISAKEAEDWLYYSDVPTDLIQESKKETAEIIDAIVKSPNPIKYSTVGQDQDLSPKSLHATFTPDDLQMLHDLKIKLHDLKAKLTTAETNDESTKDIENKISKLENEVDELSNLLNQSLPFSQ